MINSTFLKQKIDSSGGVTEFSQKLGISRQAAYDWLSGKSQPESSKLLSIAEVLNLNETDVDALMGIPPTEIFFRKKGLSEPSPEVVSRGKDLAETFFKIDGASFVARDNILISATPDTRAITNYIRTLLSTAPNEPVTLAEVLVELRKHNIAVFFLPFAKLGLSDKRKKTCEVAFTARKGSKVIIFVDTERTRDEALFDICHELAHLISLQKDEADPELVERLCNDVAQELIYPVNLLKLNEDLFKPFIDASAYSWHQVFVAFSNLARELDWSPQGLAIALLNNSYIADKSHEQKRLMKLHQTTKASRKSIDEALYAGFITNDFKAIKHFFDEQLAYNREVYRPFIELQEAATFGRLSPRKLAELLGIDTGDADELVSAWTMQREKLEAQEENGSIAEAK